jgi:serine/threonine protein kinase
LPICGAASDLHTSTIVHRDIKPANLLVFSLSSSEPVVAKLTDLRARRASPRATNKAGIVQMASNDRSGLEGTPINMAPELFDPQRHRRDRAQAVAGRAPPCLRATCRSGRSRRRGFGQASAQRAGTRAPIGAFQAKAALLEAAG